MSRRRPLHLVTLTAAAALCGSGLHADAREMPTKHQDINEVRRQLRRPRTTGPLRSSRVDKMHDVDGVDVVVKSLVSEREAAAGSGSGTAVLADEVHKEFPQSKLPRYLESGRASSNPHVSTGNGRVADVDGDEDDTLLVRVDTGTLEHATRERARAKAIWLDFLEENDGNETAKDKQGNSGADRERGNSAGGQKNATKTKVDRSTSTAPKASATTAEAGRSTTTASTSNAVDRTADEEDSTTVAIPRVILERHRRLFLTHNLQDYTFDFFTSDDGIGGWIRIHVVDGSVGYATSISTGTLLSSGVVSGLPTMEDIFAKVDQVYSTEDIDPNQVVVEYDDDVAYPTLIRYDSPDENKSIHIRTRNLTKESGSVSRPTDPEGIGLSPGNPNSESKGTSTRASPSNPTLDNLYYHQVRWSNFQVVDYDFVISIGRRRARNNRRQQSGIKVQVRSGRVINTPPQSKLSPAMRKLLACTSGTVDKVSGLGGWGEGLPELPTMDEIYSFLASSYRSTPRRKRRGIRIRYNSEVAYPTTARMPLACSAGTSKAQHKMVTFSIRNVNVIKEGGSSPDLVNPDPSFDDKVQESYNKWIEWGYSGKTSNYWFRYKRECEVGMPPEDCRGMCVTVTDGRVSDVRYVNEDSNGNTDADSVCQAADMVPEDQADNVPSITDLLEMILPSSPGRAVSGTFDSTWGYALSGHIVDRPDTTVPFRFEVQEFDLLYPNSQPSTGGDGPALVGPGGDSTMCPADVRVCTNNGNKIVTRTPPSCNFSSCDEKPAGDENGLLPNGCDATPKVCEDGSSIYMRGIPPNCVYPPCTPPGVHDADKDGPLKQPPQDGPDDPTVCKRITKLCADQETYVALDPKTNCEEYEPCPREGGPELVSGTPDDSAEERERRRYYCQSLKSCNECLNDDECAAWSPWISIGCHPTCRDAPQDIACYSPQYMNGAPEEICQKVDNDTADDDICSRHSDCNSCTGTTLTDGVSTCQWFATRGHKYCGARSTWTSGVGVTICDAIGVGWDNIQSSRLRPINNGIGSTQGQETGEDTHIRDDHHDFEGREDPN